MGPELPREVGSFERILEILSRRARQGVFLQGRKKGAKVEGPSIELAESFLEPPAADLPRQVARRAVVEDRPEGDRLTEWASRHSM